MEEDNIEIEQLSHQQTEQNPPDKIGFLELLYGIVFQPGHTLEKVAKEVPLLYSFIILFGVTFVNLMVTYLTLNPRSAIPDEIGMFSSALEQLWPLFATIGISLLLVFTLVRWYVSAAILHLTAELLGGKGRAISIFAVLGCITLPTIFMAPLVVLLYALNIQSGLMISLPFGIWVFVLMIIGLRSTYGFSVARALGTIIIPVGVFLAIITILVLSTVGFMVPLVQNFQKF